MNKPPAPDGVFRTSRMFPFAPADVFGAFANSERLAAWWGPEGFRNTFDVFQFMRLGQWSFVMHGPDGQSYSNECVFLEVSPEKIAIRHTNAPNFTLTVTLQDAGNRTHLHWHQAFDDPQLAGKIAHIIVPSNEQNLDRLQALLARVAG